MTDGDKIALSAIGGALGGIVVYVIGQLLSKFLIEPLGEVRFNLSFHAQIIHTPLGGQMKAPKRQVRLY